MGQAFVITLREGVEIALVLAIVLTYLRKTGQEALRRWVYMGVTCALAVSVVGGMALSQLEFNHDVIEGALMLVAAAFVGSMTYWMWKQGKTLRREIEGRLQKLTGGSQGPQGLGIFLFIGLIVLREGLEAVVFLKAASLNTETVWTLIGGAAGLGLALAFAIAFIRGSFRVDLRRFFSVTTAILMLLAVQLLVLGLHELSEAKVLPSSKAEMALIGPIVRNDAFFFVLVLALAILLLTVNSQKRDEPPAEGLSKADLRKATYEARRETLWKRLAAATGFIMILCIAAAFVYSSASRAPVKLQRLAVTGPDIEIPLASVADGALHHYAIEQDGVEVRFFVIKGDKEGQWGTALDACEICGNAGYYQDGRNVICRTCSSPIAVGSIGQSGGCNPIAVAARVENSMIKIPAVSLTRESTVKLFRVKS